MGQNGEIVSITDRTLNLRGKGRVVITEGHGEAAPEVAAVCPVFVQSEESPNRLRMCQEPTVWLLEPVVGGIKYKAAHCDKHAGQRIQLDDTYE